MWPPAPITSSNAEHKVSSWDCSSGKSGRSWIAPHLSVTQTQRAVIGCERIPTHYPNRLLNPAQSVQRIKGCVRHELNVVFFLCTLPISSSTMGYLCVSPCAHLTSTHSASSSARDQGLHPARVHHSLAYTPLATYHYAIRPISDRGKVFEGQWHRTPDPPPSVGTLSWCILVACTSSTPALEFVWFLVGGAQRLQLPGHVERPARETELASHGRRREDDCPAASKAIAEVGNLPGAGTGRLSTAGCTASSGRAATWSSASVTAACRLVGRWQLTHCAVSPGNPSTNCSWTTASSSCASSGDGPGWSHRTAASWSRGANAKVWSFTPITLPQNCCQWEDK